LKQVKPIEQDVNLQFRKNQIQNPKIGSTWLAKSLNYTCRGCFLNPLINMQEDHDLFIRIPLSREEFDIWSTNYSMHPILWEKIPLLRDFHIDYTSECQTTEIF